MLSKVTLLALGSLSLASSQSSLSLTSFLQKSKPNLVIHTDPKTLP
jgi:hypothetical protein